jgi:hypothetical protein
VIESSGRLRSHDYCSAGRCCWRGRDWLRGSRPLEHELGVRLRPLAWRLAWSGESTMTASRAARACLEPWYRCVRTLSLTSKEVAYCSMRVGCGRAREQLQVQLGGDCSNSESRRRDYISASLRITQAFTRSLWGKYLGAVQCCQMTAGWSLLRWRWIAPSLDYTILGSDLLASCDCAPSFVHSHRFALLSPQFTKH